MRRLPICTEDMYRLYQQGASAAEVAARFGCSVPTVKARFNREGYKMRPLSERTDRWYENIARAREGRVLNPMEKRFMEEFHRLGVPVKLNLAVGRFNIDLAYVEKKIAFEIDGSCHRLSAKKERDRAKDKALRERGWNVVRIPISSTRMTGKIVVARLCRELNIP